MSEWINTDGRLPAESGPVMVKLDRDGKELEVQKLFLTSKISGGVFMGGCRPFCENDVVKFWLENDS